MVVNICNFEIETMKSNNREQELLGALDRLIFVIAAVALIVLTASYFILPELLTIPLSVKDFLQAIITNLIPVLLLFILSYVAYRRIQSIRSQHEIEVLANFVAANVVSQIEAAAGITFLDQLPQSINSDFESSEDLWLVGVALTTPLNTLYSLMEKKLKKGHSIKILLIDPESTAIEYSDMRTYTKGNIDRARNETRGSLHDFCELKQNAPDKCEIRIIQHPLGHGIVATNPDTPGGALYISNYPFKTEGGALPKFVIRPKNGRWYELYRQELKNLWAASKEYPCVDIDNRS